MAAYARDAGIWKRLKLANRGRNHVYDAGVWKLPRRGYAYNAGVWKPTFPPYVQYLGSVPYANPGNQDFIQNVTVPENCILVTMLLCYGPVARSVTAYSVDGVAGTLAVAVPSNNMKAGIGYSAVVAGTRSVSIGLNGGNGQSGVADALVVFFAVSGYRNSVPVTAQAAGTASFVSATLTAPDDSVTLWGGVLGSNVTRTWSLASEDVYAVGATGGRSFMAATLGYNTPGSYTENVTLSASVQSAFVGINFT